MTTVRRADKFDTYGRKDPELNLDEPLLEPSTYPHSRQSPRSADTTQTPASLKDVLLVNIKMGLLAYDDVEREDRIQKKEEAQHEIVSDAQCSYIRQLVSILPGHATSQRLFATSILKTNSVLFASCGLLAYYLPSLVLVILLSQLDRKYNENYAKKVFNPQYNFYMYYMAVTIVGVCQAVLALIISNGCILFKQKAYSVFNVILVVTAFMIDNFSSSIRMMLFIMILWGVLCSIWGEPNIFRNQSIQGVIKTYHHPFLGMPALITFGVLFLFLLYFVEGYGEEYRNLYLMSSSYRIGTFTFTGGQSIIPLFLVEYNDSINKLEILKGYSFVSFLPGPMYNLSAFIGGLMNGVLGGLIAVFFIALPGLLLLMAALPYPEQFKYNSILRNFLIGAGLASIGFVFSAAYKLFIEICLTNPYMSTTVSTINVILCFTLLYSLDILVPIVLLFGGGFAMTYSMITNYVL